MSSDVAPLPKLTPEYMHKMYPKSLELVQAQVFFRHGERTPVKNNLYPNTQWLFCRRANYLHSEFMKAINKFVPIQNRSTTTLLAGIEYQPAQFEAKLSPSLEPTGNGLGGVNKKESTEEQWHPDACAPGQLTDVGLDSMYRVGAHLRSLYVDNLKFIPSTTAGKVGLLKNWLYIRSTDYTRVVQSAYALLNGLYPTRHPEAPSSALWAPLDARFLNLYPIYTRMHTYETLHANFGCPKVMREYTNLLAEDMRKIRYVDDIYKQFSQLPQIGKGAKALMDQQAFGSNFHVLYDELVCRRTHGLKIPKEVSSDMLTTLGMASHEQWNIPIRQLEGQKLGFGRLMKEIALTMKQAASIKDGEERPMMTIEQTKGDMRVAPGGIRNPLSFETHRVPKLALYAGHDITLAPLSTIFGSLDHHFQPFGSMLTIELFKDQKRDHFVRVQANGQVLQMPQCQAPGSHHPEMGSSMCTMKAFMEHVEKITPSEKELGSACSKKQKVFW